MAAIESVSKNTLGAREAAQALFREYGGFLRDTGSCGYCDPGHFDHAKFAEEIESLPDAYAEQGGELLLVYVNTTPAGCIAYRASIHAGPGVCEIKRLYIRPAFRAQGLAKVLVAEAVARAASRGFQRVILDTDLEHMPGAAELYRSFGFNVSGRQKGSIAFFERSLP